MRRVVDFRCILGIYCRKMAKGTERSQKIVMSIPRHPQKVESVRRSVTIPKAVDVRMRVRQDVNWSAVAAQAFQKVLDELEKK